MKIPIFIAFLFSVAVMSHAQDQKRVTVRVKKIEKHNGVEKISDTTYVTDASALGDADVVVREIRLPDHDLLMRLAEARDTAALMKLFPGEPGKNCSISILNDGGRQMEEMITLADQVLISDDPANITDGKKPTRVIIIRQSGLIDLTENEQEKMNSLSGTTTNALVINDLKFYPNPADGKFNLSFRLPEKAYTSISILNVEGKNVYQENLGEFQGAYQKEIDISTQPKGSYFVKVQQGNNTCFKKIILE